MFSEEIIELLQKYQENNYESICRINKNILEIITRLEEINENIASQLHKHLTMKTVDNTEELLYDSSTLIKYINSIKTIEISKSNTNQDIVTEEISEEFAPIFEKKVYPYIVSDDICPFCNVKLVNRTIFYQRNVNYKLINETVLWHKCPACNRLFALDFEIEDFDFNSTNIFPNREKYDEIPPIDIYSIIVLSNTLKCSLNHKTKDVIAKIPILNGDGKISYLKINVSYCFDCNRFTILKDDFSSIKDIVMCKVIDETVEYQNNNESEFDIEQKKSILAQYGYNVQTKKDLSEQQRHIILSSLIEAHILTRREVIDHINTLIERGSKIPNWKTATQKWRDDKQFVAEYRSDSLPEVIFNNIVLKYKRPK